MSRTTSPATTARSSRTTPVGWEPGVEREGEWIALSRKPVFRRRFNWLRPRVLLESRNSALAELIRRARTDIVNDERRRWMAAQRTSGALDAFPRLTINASELGDLSFLIVGDPGEGDASQYVLVPHLIKQGCDTAFMVVLSDVIYPTGESNDYVDCFYRPYQEYARPIYAVPGNHDWYSLLTGFMWHFCGAEPLPSPTYRLASYTWQERLARFLWLRPRAPARTLLEPLRAKRWSYALHSASEPTSSGVFGAVAHAVSSRLPAAAPKAWMQVRRADSWAAPARTLLRDRHRLIPVHRHRHWDERDDRPGTRRVAVQPRDGREAANQAEDPADR